MTIKKVKWESLGKKNKKWEPFFDKRASRFFFELKIKDETNRNVGRFIWNNPRKWPEILETLRLKFGLNYRNPPT